MDKEILGKRESAKSAIIMFPLTMLDKVWKPPILLLSLPPLILLLFPFHMSSIFHLPPISYALATS